MTLPPMLSSSLNGRNPPVETSMTRLGAPDGIRPPQFPTVETREYVPPGPKPVNHRTHPGVHGEECSRSRPGPPRSPRPAAVIAQQGSEHDPEAFDLLVEGRGLEPEDLGRLLLHAA